ncbi:MAG: hypothetical protein A2096_11210 [Spirochaetes bacterium GWF1_41_5]|nr:MAG: hypothetical protein A2096_11210 [Spirochaetes bacterium GWF1_41_5]HBE02358.1 hypothetical protein [Spirochaetia bacterium]
MSVNIKNIANHCGVSFKTVSNVIRGYNFVKDETREKVLNAVRELGYIPNESASRLAKLKCKTDGKKNSSGSLKMGCILGDQIDKYHDPYFWSVFKGIEQEINNTGHNLIFFKTCLELEKNPVIFNTLCSPYNLDGIISFVGTDRKKIFLNISSAMPLVSIGAVSGYDSIVIDKTCGARLAVEYLSGLGHKKIGFIGKVKNLFNRYDERFTGFLTALDEYGLERNEEWYRGNAFGHEAGYSAACELLGGTNLPTAVFCISDLTAFGALKAFRQKDIRVPADVSVIGFDDIFFSEFINPPLTTIHVDSEEIGRCAVNALSEKIRNPAAGPVTRMLPVSLKERESCCRYDK